MELSRNDGRAGDQLLVHRTDQAARIGSILEVLLAFIVVHVAYRSFKHFTGLGHRESAAHVNFSPGAVMILATVPLVILAGRSFADYGLTARNWQRNLNIGLVAALLVATGVGLLAALNIRPNHACASAATDALKISGGLSRDTGPKCNSPIE